MAINVDGNAAHRNASSIKFGNYDRHAIDPAFNGGDPKMFNTISFKKWNIL
jgi:hypothetical protein